MISTHLASLERKHAHLEKKIHDEQTHTSGDDLLIERLKKEKLHLKEEIESLRRRAG